MTEYMKEALRLAQAYADAVLLGEGNDEALAALLAHIQRGVPEGWQVVPIDPTPEMLDAAEGVDWGDEDMRGSCCNQWHAMLAAAPAPDQFRDAAGMVAEPANDRIAAAIHYPECWDTAAYPTVESALSEVFAHYRCTEHEAPSEVPMPEPDWVTFSRNAEGVGVRVDSLRMEGVARYGTACRAAGEAAGYARGLKEAGQDAERHRWLRRHFAIVGTDNGAVFHALNLPTPTHIAPDAAIELDASIDAALRGEVKP